MKRRYLYLHTFSRIAFIILATVIVLSVGLFVTFQKINSSLVQYYTADQLYQIKQSTDMILDNARRTIMTYSANGDVLKLINYSDEMDSLELYQTLRRISTLQQQKAQPEYVCFYDSNSGSLFYQSKKYSADSFPDQGLIRMLRGGVLPNYYPLFRSSPDYERLYLNSPADHYMYSLVYTTSAYGRSNNAIVLNIPAANIDALISGYNAAIGQELIIVNSDMQVVRGNNSFAYNATIENEPALESVIKDGSESGYLIDTINGEKCLISYIQSGIVDWTYLRITPYSSITRMIRDTLWKTALIALAILLPLILIGALISRSINSVFKRIFGELETLFKSKEQKNSDITARQEYLRKVFRGMAVMSEEDRSAYQIKIPVCGPYTVLLLSIDQFLSHVKSDALENKGSYTYEIGNVISEELGQKYPCETAEFGDGIYAVWIGEAIAGFAPLQEAISGVQQRILAIMNVTVSVVLGDPVMTPTDLPYCISECIGAFHYRLYYDGHMCVSMQDIRQISQSDGLSDHDISVLIDLLMLGKRDELRAKCHALSETLKCLPYSKLQVSVMKIAIKIQDAVSEKGLGSGAVQLDEWFDFVKSIADCPTIQTVEYRLNDLFDKTISGMVAENRVKNMRFSRLFAEVQHIIEADYPNDNLTPENIAQRLSISPEYFKKIYKNNTGIALSEDINQYRLNLVIEKLKTSTQPITDIAKQCGFPNINYFYTLFKRKYGVTAVEYRRIHYH